MSLGGKIKYLIGKAVCVVEFKHILIYSFYLFILSFSFLHILLGLQLVCEVDNIFELLVGDVL